MTEAGKSTARTELALIAASVSSCTRCARLVEWRVAQAGTRAAFRSDEYWSKGVPGFGDAHATLVIIGLAPAAHGANRTGRMFTGDRSGTFLFGALARAGYANKGSSEHRGDGLRLSGAYVTAAVRCAPPDNKPTPQERESCREYLEAELDALGDARVLLVLGRFAFDATMRLLRARDLHPVMPSAARFSHNAAFELEGPSSKNRLALLCSYHPSQRNVFTGRLTEAHFDEVLRTARALGA